MPALIVMAIIFLLLGFAMLSNRSPAQQVGLPTADGILGRGLILQASSTPSGRSTVNGQRYESRALVLDVELPGQQPYEVSITPLIPRVVEALPGVAVDVRVDPKDPTNVSIVGPAGSSAWLSTAMPLVQQTAAGVPNTAGTGAAGVVFLVIGLAFGGIAVAVGLANADEKPRGGYCAGAVRCCKAAGLTKCTKYETMSSKSCESVWKGLKQQAAKLHNTCD
ncbi:MAG: hypothetical protein ACXWUG_10185 [Polyangiales bacterium]